MIALWWLVSLALVALSALLLVAGLQGKEGVLRIGQPAGTPPEDASGQPSGQLLDGQSGPPGDAEGQGPPGSRAQGSPQDLETQPRRMNLPNVAIGAAGVVAGLGAILIFAI